VAPELLEGESASIYSDMWSIGCTVIELITGRPPYYDLGQMAAIFQIVEADTIPPPEDCSPV